MQNELTPQECIKILENWPRNCNPLKKYISRMQAAEAMRKLAANELMEVSEESLDNLKTKIVNYVKSAFKTGFETAKCNETYFDDGLDSKIWESINDIFTAWLMEE